MKDTKINDCYLLIWGTESCPDLDEWIGIFSDLKELRKVYKKCKRKGNRIPGLKLFIYKFKVNECGYKPIKPEELWGNDVIDDIFKILKEARTYEDIEENKDFLIEYIPAVKRMFDYDQKNSSHQYNLWEHCVHTVLNLPKNIDDDLLYLAALLHDIGKPDYQCDGKREGDTNKHYYGHPEKSAEIIETEVIPYLKNKGIELTEEEQASLIYYVKYHDDRVSLRIKHLRKHLKLTTFEEFKNLMLLQVADAKAHVMIPIIRERADICSKWASEYGQEMYYKLLLEEKTSGGNGNVQRDSYYR